MRLLPRAFSPRVYVAACIAWTDPGNRWNPRCTLTIVYTKCFACMLTEAPGYVNFFYVKFLFLFMFR